MRSLNSDEDWPVRIWQARIKYVIPIANGCFDQRLSIRGLEDSMPPGHWILRSWNKRLNAYVDIFGDVMPDTRMAPMSETWLEAVYDVSMIVEI